MHDERLRVEFNEWANTGRGASMERGHRPTGEQAIELLEIETDSQVLDLGCGNGWASRSMAAIATYGRVVGIDVSDRMVDLARAESAGLANVEFRVGSAENLPFADGAFTRAFSMESLYYYAAPNVALAEIRRVLAPGGRFAAVVDLYRENEPSLQWVEQLQVPVQVLSIDEYRTLFADAGFDRIEDRRLIDTSPMPETYTGTSFRSQDEYVRYRENGSLMISGWVK
jgi:ubiquinone/menaquinone biosynthesis C-methylase UbiE